MNIELFLYLIDILNGIRLVLYIALIFSTIIYILHVFFSSHKEDNRESLKKTLKYGNKIKWYYIIMLIFYLLIPSQKTMYLMMGSHYLKNSQIPSKVEMVLNKKLDEYLIEKEKK